MKKLLDKTNMTERDWQDYRKSQIGIGGSDVAVILGISPFKSPFGLWLEKTGQVKPKELTSENVEWGNLLEPVIRDKFARETGFETFVNPWVLQHDEHEFMIANVDGECIDPDYNGEKGILEIKTTDARNKAQWEEGCPDYYMCQVQHYLGVTGYQYAYICVLIGGNHFKYFKVERNDYVIDKIIEAELRFMDMINQKIPPEISHQLSDSEWLAECYPNARDVEVDMPKHIEIMAWRYTEIQSDMKELEKEAQHLKNLILYEAKEIKAFKNESMKISMPTIEKTLFDSKLFSSDNPDLYKQYKTKKSSYRGFTVTILGDK